MSDIISTQVLRMSNLWRMFGISPI